MADPYTSAFHDVPMQGRSPGWVPIPGPSVVAGWSSDPSMAAQQHAARFRGVCEGIPVGDSYR